MDPTTLNTLLIIGGNLLVALIGLWGIHLGRQVVKAVNGMTTRRVDDATALGDARAEIARHEGGDAARAAMAGPAEVSIVDTAITIPVEIKGKLP